MFSGKLDQGEEQGILRAPHPGERRAEIGDIGVWAAGHVGPETGVGQRRMGLGKQRLCVVLGNYRTE